ncbi:hypothetical protein C8R45DRAFT_1206849 [Mycena sanguinolenta]|nr:hypothetical protein C8R45DRAFT_1206849 [Mycena sanguinolenta]
MNPLECNWTVPGEARDAPLTVVPEYWLHRAEIIANAPLPDDADDDTNEDQDMISPTITPQLSDSTPILAPFSEAATSGTTEDKDKDFISRLLTSLIQHLSMSIDYANELPAPIDLQFVAPLVEWELKRVVEMLQQRAGFDFARARPAIQTKSNKRNVHEAQIFDVGVPGHSKNCFVHLRVAVSIKKGQITRTLKLR